MTYTIEIFSDVKIATPNNTMEYKELKNPYWAKIWHSSIALHKYIIEHKEFFEQKHILELGAGLGLPALTAASINAAAVSCTDIAADAITYINKSIELNKITNCKAFIHDWNTIIEYSAYDIVLLSDINYEPKQFENLTMQIELMLNAKLTVFLASPQRLLAKPFIEKLQPYIKQQTEFEIDDNAELNYISIFQLGVEKFS